MPKSTISRVSSSWYILKLWKKHGLDSPDQRLWFSAAHSFTSFAEATLENLLVAIASNEDIATAANLSTLRMSAGDIGDVPLERGIVAVGPGSGSATINKERIYVAYRALSIENVTVSAKRDEASMFEVSFRLLPNDNASYGKIVDRTLAAPSA